MNACLDLAAGNRLRRGLRVALDALGLAQVSLDRAVNLGKRHTIALEKRGSLLVLRGRKSIGQRGCAKARATNSEGGGGFNAYVRRESLAVAAPCTRRESRSSSQSSFFAASDPFGRDGDVQRAGVVPAIDESRCVVSRPAFLTQRPRSISRPRRSTRGNHPRKLHKPGSRGKSH